MMQESQLEELVARWRVARESGQPVTLEELCAGSPELLPALRSTLIRLHGLETIDTAAPRSIDETRPFDPKVNPSMTCNGHRYRIGNQVEGFRLVREIGSGGFGQVFEAEDSMLKRRVAIKFLLPHAHEHAGIRQQFLAEARSMASIQHENVVPIFQVGQVDSNLFIVMPLLAGETLASRLKREGSLAPEEVRRIGRELCHGLAALHAKGLVHRDIKPANLWLDMSTGRVKVLDLGLADDAANLKARTSAGTPAYMSPEQVDGRDLDFRSDLFSVGAVLYECATGRRAFLGEKITEVMESVRAREPEPLQEVNPGVPPDLSKLIHRLMNKDRMDRPVSALEVAEALHLSGVSTFERKRHWVRTYGLASAIVLLGLVSGVSVFLMNRPDSKAPSKIETRIDPRLASPLVVESLQVIPWKSEGDQLTQALPPLGSRDYVLPTTADAIEVKAKLSHPAYAYIILYRSDGQEVLLYPQDDEAVPTLTNEPRYPSTRPDVRYVLDDGPGVWAVAILASDLPLPSYRTWRQQRPNQPWKPQPDPSHLSTAMLDNGSDWQMLGSNRTYSRGERQFQLEPYQLQMDWLKQQAKDGTVMGVAFPVR